MSTEFTVRGSHLAVQRPERGVVRATISCEGPAMQPAYDGVVAGLDAVTTSIEEHHRPEHGPVTSWSAQHLRTWVERPWDHQGQPLPLVHHASVEVEVTFSDFTVLSRWVGDQVGSEAGFSLDAVTWELTEERREELERSARSEAVHDAVRRAQQYADALGLGPVRPVAVADAGMLGEGLSPASAGSAAYLRASAKESGSGDVELSPADIRVVAEVDARFVAG